MMLNELSNASGLNNKEEIKQTYISKHNLKHENQVVY